MSKNTERNMLMQGTILAAAGFLTKIIGFVYRIPMANLLGNDGNGIYSVAFGIYNIISTVVFEKQADGKVLWRHLHETFSQG